MVRLLRPFCKYTKRNPFSPSFYIQNAECIPITIICGIVIGMVSFCSVRTFFNTDVVATRNMKSPGERTELLLNPRHRKLVWISQVYEPMEDLYNLYEDMKNAEQDQKGGCPEDEE